MTTKISGDNISAIANTGVTWNAVTVADGSTQLNASAGNGYFLDTNAGVIEVFLPSSPTRGDTIVLADYASNFATNNVIVNTGGQLIDSTETAVGGFGYVLSTNDLVVELVYVDSNKGWLVKENEAKNSLTAQEDTNKSYITATGGTITTSGDYKVHAFTGDGCFVVSSLGLGNPCVQNSSVDYLVVAGGGGARHNGGGGGAGGFRVSNVHGLPAPTTSPLASPTGITVTATTYPITVGAGGSGGSPGGSDGSNSTFSTITSAGGGLSGGQNPGDTAGNSGGSGGGGDYNSNGSGPGAGGSGNTPPTSPAQGTNGGPGGNPYNPSYSGGGGGGAACAGTPGGSGSNHPLNGRGGHGSYINPAFGGCYGTDGDVKPAAIGARHFSGGGGAAGNPANDAANVYGGEGGGEIGNNSPAGGNGTANTGGGGGGNPNSGAGGDGGKGIVLIRYKYQ